jgi:lipopolysaccharide transport system ATP-binding protein
MTMDKNVAIRIDRLGKMYRIKKVRKNQMLRDVIAEGISNAVKTVTGHGNDIPKKKRMQPFWALKDITLDINKGESLGIIGANGAGKSTLLKLLTRITSPTEGEFTIRGRVGSLLEVGTGFHTELTGRENVYLNGVILGMKRKEIDRKFDEIVSFAEVEQFIDTQVKHFSSGMKMRLAFSVAAHLEPEVMLVDEVLAVGDIAFQRKSLDKMGEVISGGRTVLFVSHNIAAVRALCSKAVFLDNGQMVSFGDIDTVTRQYMNSRSAVTLTHTIEPIITYRDAQILSVVYLDNEGKPQQSLPHNKPFTIFLKTQINRPQTNLFMVLKIFNSELELILETHDFEMDENLLEARQPGVEIKSIKIPAPLLAPGQYYIGVGVNKKKGQGNIHAIQKVDHIAPFTIYDNGSILATHSIYRHGLVHIELPWEKRSIDEFNQIASTSDEI